jgi:hypothetical protein
LRWRRRRLSPKRSRPLTLRRVRIPQPQFILRRQFGRRPEFARQPRYTRRFEEQPDRLADRVASHRVRVPRTASIPAELKVR